MTAAPSTAESLSSSVSQPLLSPIPPPVPVETHPNRGALKRPIVGRYDLKHLSPEDVRESSSPSRPRPPTGIGSPLISDLDGTIPSSSAAIAAAAAAAALRPAVASLRPPPAIPTSARLRHESKRRSASRKRRQPGGWKKLLWIRQPCTSSSSDLYLLIGSPADRQYQTLTISPTPRPSLIIFNEIQSFVLMTFGPWLQTRR